MDWEPADHVEVDFMTEEEIQRLLIRRRVIQEYEIEFNGIYCRPRYSTLTASLLR